MMTKYTQLRSLPRGAADLILQQKKNAAAGPVPPGMQDAAPRAMAMPQPRAPLAAQGPGKPVAVPSVQEPQRVVNPQSGTAAPQPGVNAVPMVKRYSDPKEQQSAQRWLESVKQPGAVPYRPPEPEVNDMVQRGVVRPQAMTLEMRQPTVGKGGMPGVAGGYEVPPNTTTKHTLDTEDQLLSQKSVAGQAQVSAASAPKPAKVQTEVNATTDAGQPLGQAAPKPPAAPSQAQPQGASNTKTGTEVAQPQVNQGAGAVNAPAAPAPQQPAPGAAPSRAEAATAMRAEAEKKAAAAQLENARKAGAVIENGKTVPHPDGKGGLLHETGFAADSFRDDAELGPVIPYRDDHGKQHAIPVRDIARVTDKDGKASYQFMVGGRPVSVPEGQKPLFQVDQAGKRYSTAADGTRQELGADTRAMAQNGVAPRVEAADKSLQEKLAKGADLKRQLEQKQAQADAARQRFLTAQKTVDAMDRANAAYGPDAPPKPTFEQQAAARQELLEAHLDNEKHTQDLQDLQKQHDAHYRALAEEQRARQAEIGRYQGAAAASPHDAPWQKDAASLQGDPRVTHLGLIAEAEKKDPASAEAMRRALVPPPTQRLFDAAEKSFGGAQPAEGQSMSLHEMLMQAPQMTQGKGARQTTVDQAAAARATAQHSLGIADPENVRVTRGADGSYTLSRPAADGRGTHQPFATLDPKTNRITLKPGLDGKFTQAAADLAASGSASSTPVFLPGGQPPMSEAEVSDLIQKGQQATSSTSDRKAADAALTKAGLSPEGISQLVQQGRLSVQDGQLLNSKFNSGVSSYADRDKADAARQHDTDLQRMYEQGKGPQDKPHFKSWQEKGDPQRDAQVKAMAEKMGVSEDAVRRDLETRRLMDWSTPLTQQSHDAQSGVLNGLKRGVGLGTGPDATRTLPDGTLMPNPELGSDRAKFDAAIDAAQASPEAKAKARELWGQYHDNYLTNVRSTLETMQTLPGVENYMAWRERMQKDGAFSRLSENQKAEQYMQEQKDRPWYTKLADTVGSNLIAGSHDLVAGIAGTAGLLTGSQAMSDFAAEKAGQAERSTAALKYTGSDGLLHNVIGGIARAAPGLAAAGATGGMAGGAAVAFVQGAGSTYADLYQHGIDQGLKPEEARRAAAGAAIASGAVSAALGKIMPGGAQALNNPATREAAKKSFGMVLKSALKGAAEEIPQEVIDGGFNHIATEMAKGRSFNEAAASYAEQFPQSVLTTALLGGTAQAAGDHLGGGESSPQTPPGASQKTPGNTTQTGGEMPQVGDGKPTQSPSLPPPTTPPKSVEDSKKLIDNVSKMPPEAQQHPQVEADRSQAEQVLQEHVQKLESQKEPLSEAQKKELAEAKTALSRLPAENPTTQRPEAAARPEDAARPAEATPESTRRPESANRPHGEADPDARPAKADPSRTYHADTYAEDPRSRGDSDGRLHPAGTQPDGVRPGRKLPADAEPPTRGYDSSAPSQSGRNRPDGRPLEPSYPAPARDSSTARNAGDTTPYHPATSADSADATNPQTADRPTNRNAPDQVQNVPANPSARPIDNSHPPSTNTPATSAAAPANSSQSPPAAPTRSTVRPSTPPLSVAQSQRLIDNVSKMPPETRQHSQVQADVAQARDVVAATEAQNKAVWADSKSQYHHDSTTLSSGKVQAAWKPSSHPEGGMDRAAADKWHKRLNELRNVRNPASVEEAVSWRPEHPVTPDLQRKIFTATQTFLDMLPRNLVKDLGPVKLSVKASLDEGASGEYDYMTDTMALSHEKIKTYTPQQLRAIMWHEMAHWLYYSAQLNPKASPALKAWRAKIDAHWRSRTKGEIIGNHQSGWRYIRDGWISDYAGRLYPGQDGGIEIPSVYLEKAAFGPDELADWCRRFPDEEETFEFVLSIFKN